MNRNLKVVACALAAVALGAPVAIGATQSGFLTIVKAYTTPITSDYEVTPLLSVGDDVPRTSNHAQPYQLIGIVDGLGGVRHGQTVDLFVNHELSQTITSAPISGAPLQRGAFVSKYKLAQDGSVLSGDLAYDQVYTEDTYVGPTATIANATPAFTRFCSGSLADSNVGFDQPIYLTGEESGGASTFDGKGGSAAAIFNGEAHVLPKLGRFAKENVVVMPHTGPKTVILATEDGPSAPDSQLWMYVGTKRPGASSVLRRNGLDNGKLYVFKADGHVNEGDFQNGSTSGEWIEIPNAESMTDAQLEAAADAVGAFGFIRIEDAAGGQAQPGQAHFVTTGSSYSTGGAPFNELGRIYRLDFSTSDPTSASDLSVIVNADDVIADGGDTAISPDNIAISSRYLMVQEDGTSESRAVMASKGRDGSIWRYDLTDDYAASRVAELDPPGRDGVPIGPGVWETTGIIDAGQLLGPDTWLFNVQAHAPTAVPESQTVEDGQLLVMRPSS